VEATEELCYNAVSSDMHAESRNHTLGSQRDCRQTSCGNRVIFGQGVKDVVYVIIKHIEFSSLLNLVSIFHIPHYSKVLKKNT